jgi:hypothetical protein
MFIYHIEITDLFGGDRNYCRVRRYRVRAKTMAGAMRVMSRYAGIRYKQDYSAGDMVHYISGCVGYLVERYDADNHTECEALNFKACIAD